MIGGATGWWRPTPDRPATLGAHRGSPTVGDCVYFAPGACVFGPITIGGNVAVGANAVVNHDGPAGATVVAGRADILPDRPNMPPDESGP